jgi:hypothetical protein
VWTAHQFPLEQQLPVRFRAVSVVVSLVAALCLVTAPAPTPVHAAGEKVAIIVGPVGSLTSSYRSRADQVAAAATAAGATVVKAYSPTATWPNVLAAVNGANVIVYLGHGNGYPNPYGSTELTDRTNGWGLNTATTNGDADSWSAGTLVYCGEKALLGTLSASDGVAQRTHCGGGPITPAPGFTMVYAQAHYAPGFGERYEQSTPLTTLAEAQARVANYSHPILTLGGTFIATAYSDAHEIVGRLLTQSGTSYGTLFAAGRGYSPSTLTRAAHPNVGGAETWVQLTTITGFHFGEPDYWYAFAGDPNRTPGSGQAPPIGPFRDIGSSGFINDILWLAASGITSGCAPERFCPSATVTREQMASFLARGLSLPGASADYFNDDVGSPHEADINRLAAAGIVSGCGNGAYCPTLHVSREQMASYLARALGLPGTATDYFGDDSASMHQADINRVAAAGIASGCGGGSYCPGALVTREQMAAFLHRALGN